MQSPSRSKKAEEWGFAKGLVPFVRESEQSVDIIDEKVWLNYLFIFYFL